MNILAYLNRIERFDFTALLGPLLPRSLLVIFVVVSAVFLIHTAPAVVATATDGRRSVLLLAAAASPSDLEALARSNGRPARGGVPTRHG